MDQIRRLAARRDDLLLKPVLDRLILREATFLVEEETVVQRNDLDAILVRTKAGRLLHVVRCFLLGFGFRP